MIAMFIKQIQIRKLYDIYFKIFMKNLKLKILEVFETTYESGNI